MFAKRLNWILDGYVLGEYDIHECGARLSRAVAAEHIRREEATR